MLIPYDELPERAGGWPRPLLDVVVGGMDEAAVPCLVDSGSEHTLLPAWVSGAAAIPVDAVGVRPLRLGGFTTNASMTTVRLTAAEATWEAEVGFCDPWDLSFGLLGQRSYFTVTFRAADFESRSSSTAPDAPA